MTFVIISSFAPSVVNFRLPLIRELQKKGFRVHVVCAFEKADLEYKRKLEQCGVLCHHTDLKRANLGVFGDLRYFLSIFLLLQRIRPSHFLCYTKKPIVYGGLAGWLLNIPRRSALVTGLGFAYNVDRLNLLHKAIRAIFKFSLTLFHCNIFMNKDDLIEIFGVNRVASSDNIHIIEGGSGVDLEHFQPAPLSEGPVSFLFVGRLLQSKGIEEFLRAACLLENRGMYAQYTVVGDFENNLDAVSKDIFSRFETKVNINWLGHLEDVREPLSNSHVFVLPSYREGLPRSVLEAMATARPIITTDVPGCKETVESGKNGFLVKKGDFEGLAEKMSIFINNPQLIKDMGEKSRELAEAKFCSKLTAQRLSSLLT